MPPSDEPEDAEVEVAGEVPVDAVAVAVPEPSSPTVPLYVAEAESEDEGHPAEEDPVVQLEVDPESELGDDNIELAKVVEERGVTGVEDRNDVASAELAYCELEVEVLAEAADDRNVGIDEIKVEEVVDAEYRLARHRLYGSRRD